MKFKALVSSESNKKYESKVQSRTIQDLPEGDVLIKVYFSSLNYKAHYQQLATKVFRETILTPQALMLQEL